MVDWKIKVDDIQGAKLERAKIEALRAIAEELEKIRTALER